MSAWLWREMSTSASCPQALTRAFFRYGCHMIVVGGVQSPARQAPTRVSMRYGGHVIVASHKISWWKCRSSSSGPSSSCRSQTSEKCVEIVLQDRVQRWNAEQIEDFPNLLDVEEPVFITCRRECRQEIEFERCVSA